MEKQQAWRIISGKNTNPGYFTVQRLVEGVGCTMVELAEMEEAKESETPKKGRKGDPQ